MLTRLVKHKYMKTKSLVVVTALVALMGVTHAEEGKKKAAKAPTPEQLEKYDADKDGALSTDEKAAMKKDKPAKAPKAPTPEQLEKYDADKDGALSVDERAAMKKDKPVKEKKEKKPKAEKEAAPVQDKAPE